MRGARMLVTVRYTACPHCRWPPDQLVLSEVVKLAGDRTSHSARHLYSHRQPQVTSDREVTYIVRHKRVEGRSRGARA